MKKTKRFILRCRSESSARASIPDDPDRKRLVHDLLERVRVIRKGVNLDDVTIRQLIDEGRRF